MPVHVPEAWTWLAPSGRGRSREADLPVPSSAVASLSTEAA